MIEPLWKKKPFEECSPDAVVLFSLFLLSLPIRKPTFTPQMLKMDIEKCMSVTHVKQSVQNDARMKKMEIFQPSNRSAHSCLIWFRCGAPCTYIAYSYTHCTCVSMKTFTMEFVSIFRHLIQTSRYFGQFSMPIYSNVINWFETSEWKKEVDFFPKKRNLL